MSELKYDPSVMKAWDIAISLPKEDEKRGWRINKNLTVYAGLLQSAVNIVEAAYPKCVFWSITHRGVVDNKGDGLIWERTWH